MCYVLRFLHVCCSVFFHHLSFSASKCAGRQNSEKQSKAGVSLLKIMVPEHEEPSDEVESFF